MPELPDVQVFKEYLDSTALHQRILGLELISAARMLKDVSARTIETRLKGRGLDSTRRHGKHLFAHATGNGWLRLHFGMTGDLKYYKDDDTTPQHVRLRLDFSNGYHLAYIDVRKFGEIGLVHDVDCFIKERNLGPDALALDLDAFRQALRGRRGAIKSTLMNQSIIAGIGNLYADEILFAARIRPTVRTEKLDDHELRDLHRAMRTVFAKAIDARADLNKFPRSFLLRQRTAGGRCPRCGTRLARTTIGGRMSYYCPQDQRRKS